MMVCPYNDEQLLLILQVDHSKVTGWLAAHWGNDDFAPPSPYDAMVLAAQEHDTGWWDWEIKPQLNDEGLPPDYIGSIKHLGQTVWLDFYRHGITRLAEQDAVRRLCRLPACRRLVDPGKRAAFVHAGLFCPPGGPRISPRAGIVPSGADDPIEGLTRVSGFRVGRTTLDELQAHGNL